MFRLILIPFLILVSIKAHSQQICETGINDLYSSEISRVERLRMNCEQQGGHNPVTEEEQRISCTSYTNIMSEIHNKMAECRAAVQARGECERSGAEWVQHSGHLAWEGNCTMTCAEGTELQTASMDMGINGAICVCPQGSSEPYINPGVDSTACGNVNDGEDCGEDPGGFATQAQRQAYEACIARNQEEEQIAEELERNTDKASEEAQKAAEKEVEEKVEEAARQAVAECSPNYQTFVNNCRAVSAQVPDSGKDFSGAGSAEACRSLKESSHSVIEQLNSQVKNCISQGEVVFASCKTSTGQVVGTGSSTVGSGRAQGSSRATANGGSGIPENQAKANEVRALLNELTSKSTNLSAQMRNIESEADKCIASFEGKEEQQKDDSPETKDRWGGLAKTAQGAFQELSKSKNGNISGSYASSSELGRSGGGSRAASTPGYSAGGGSYSPSGSIDGGGLSGLPGIGGGSDSSGGNSSKQTNTPFPTAGSNNNNGRVNSVAGPARAGGGGGLNFSNDDTNFKVKDENGKRIYTKAKERNLVLGFKKAKVGGGGAVTYSPDAFRKFGKSTMKKKLKEARKKYGSHTPLLFKDGKFVRDYLQMKESLAFKRYNNRQKRKLSGLGEVDKKDQVQEVFHDCVRFEECYTEARYNIFKLHHFKVRKSLYGE